MGNQEMDHDIYYFFFKKPKQNKVHKKPQLGNKVGGKKVNEPHRCSAHHQSLYPPIHPSSVSNVPAYARHDSAGNCISVEIPDALKPHWPELES